MRRWPTASHALPRNERVGRRSPRATAALEAGSRRTGNRRRLAAGRASRARRAAHRERRATARSARRTAARSARRTAARHDQAAGRLERTGREAPDELGQLGQAEHAEPRFIERERAKHGERVDRSGIVETAKSVASKAKGPAVAVGAAAAGVVGGLVLKNRAAPQDRPRRTRAAALEGPARHRPEGDREDRRPARPSSSPRRRRTSPRTSSAPATRPSASARSSTERVRWRRRLDRPGEQRSPWRSREGQGGRRHRRLRRAQRALAGDRRRCCGGRARRRPAPRIAADAAPRRPRGVGAGARRRDAARRLGGRQGDDHDRGDPLPSAAARDPRTGARRSRSCSTDARHRRGAHRREG